MEANASCFRIKEKYLRIGEYSKNLILQSFSEKISKEEIQNLMDILNRGEAVRFAPISSEDALADKTRIKEILTKAHHDWK